MSGGDERTLTEDDVKAIVSELKSQLVKDFQIEVGKGVLGWVRRAAVLLLILLAVYGFSKTGWLPKASGRTTDVKVSAAIGKAAMKVAGVVPQGFTVLPPKDAPDELIKMAEEIDRLNREQRT